MSELDAHAPTPRPAAARSWKVTAAVIALAVLPLVLPLPFLGLAVLWIAPLDSEAWSHCIFGCPAVTHLEQLEGLLVLGPSLLVAVASILVGTIGLIRARKRPTSSEIEYLFASSLACGIIWAIPFGCILWFWITALAGTKL